MAYDVKCEELARLFLADEDVSDAESIAKLSQHIQSEIEDWITYYVRQDDAYGQATSDAMIPESDKL